MIRLMCLDLNFDIWSTLKDYNRHTSNSLLIAQSENPFAGKIENNLHDSVQITATIALNNMILFSVVMAHSVFLLTSMCYEHL